MGWEPGGDNERLAQELLDKNAAIIFKLSGLAQLRRHSGANLPPSAQEEALLAEAQHCLQSVAMLLPPKALMQPTAAKRLRQHLLEPPVLPTAAGPAAVEEEDGGGKRQQLDLQPMQQHQQQQQQQQQQQHQHQQHPGLAPPLQQMHSLGGAPAYSGGSAGARPSLVGTLAGAASLQPPPSALGGGLQSAPSASQGSMLGLALSSGRMPAAEAAAAAAATLGGGPARSSGSMQLGQLGLGQQQPAALRQQQPPAPLAAALQEPTAKEDLWLLSQAYGSMTAEQKEKLAAQPPEVRQFVIRERMRKTREQLELLQRQRAAAQAKGLAGQPVQAPGREPWGGLAPPGVGGGLAAQPQAQQQMDWPAVGPGGPPQFAQQGRQHSLGGMPSGMLDLPTPQDSMRLPSFSGSLARANNPPAFPSLQPPPGQQQLAPLFPQQPGLLQPQAGPGALGAPGAGAGGADLSGGAAPFVAMSEADRLEHLRRLKRRQDEWLEQQRRAAAMLSEGGAAG
ncbi:hypothetical protein ABPG75_007148 [Micractinium tetrahymenae]